MLRSFLRHYLLTGATVAGVAVAAYLATSSASGGDSSSSNNLKEGKKRVNKRCKPSGLVNSGNTCFINTTLQALAACPFFVCWLETVLNKLSTDLQQSVPAAVNLHKTLTVINNRTSDPYETRQLVNSLQGHGWRLNSEEQDAHEFFNLLSTTVDEEVHLKRRTETIIPSIFSGDGGETNNSRLYSRPSPFQGYLASQLCCLTCGYKAPVRYDAFECLSIPLPKLDIKNAFNLLNVEGLLRSFLGPETVGEVQCGNCPSEKRNVFTKQLSLGKLPQCLCLHIQRCDWSELGQLSKRQDLVRFAEELNVSPFVYTHRLAGSFSKPVVYILRAVVEHLGVADSGHFVTFRRGQDLTKWYYTSDTLVRSTTFEEVLKSCPYMLFYERCT